jgi:hypothetical protein
VTRLGNLEAEAGNRTQSEKACNLHTGVKGVPKMKQSLEKCHTAKQGYTTNTPDSIRATTRYIVSVIVVRARVSNRQSGSI